jgi:RNA polymerase sigma-70 factor (ECF subfamily)
MQEAKQLLQAFQNRDVKATKELFDSVFTRLRFLAKRITHDDDEAIDIAMNSISSLWEPDLSQTDKIHNVMGYLTTRVQRDAIDYLRKQKSKRNYENHFKNTEEQDEEFILERARYETEVIHLIYEEIDRLPEKTKEVFKKVYLEKVPRNEVATQMHISINTVHVHCSNAINALRHVVSEKELFVVLMLLNLYKN